MTRDTKLALVVGFALILAVGVLISDHFASGNRGEPEDLVGTSTQTPILPLASTGDPARTGARAPERSDVRDTGHRTSGWNIAERPLAHQDESAPAGVNTDPNPDRRARAVAEIATPEPVTFWQGRTPPASTSQGTIAQGLLPHERDDAGGGPGQATRLGPEGRPDADASSQRDARIQTIPLAQLEQTLARNAGRMPEKEASAETGDRWHIVREGESLWEIADRYYSKGAAWTEIVRANPGRVSDDGGVRVGVRIRLPNPRSIGVGGWAVGESSPTPARTILKPQPDKVSATRDAGKDRAKESKDDGVRTITVRKGETLGQIAQRELGRASRMEEIIRLNADQIDDADEIRAGMVLRLPK